MSQLPKEITIGASTWKVELVDRDLRDREESGECDWAHCRILIAAELGDHEREHTFVHELLHACCRFAGFAGEKCGEEEFVTRLAPALHMLMKQNGFWPSAKGKKV